MVTFCRLQVTKPVTLEKGRVRMTEKKRYMVHIPEQTEAYKFLFDNRNSRNKAKWELIEESIKLMPKTKAERAQKLYKSFMDEMDILYPGSHEGLSLVWRLIAKRIMKVKDIVDNKEVYLNEDFFK